MSDLAGRGRAIPTTGIAHPLADSVSLPGAEAWVATETRAPVVGFSQARASLLELAARDHRRPVLVTDGTSVLTAVMANVWQRSGGAWVVREVGDGLRNGFTGRRLARFEDAWLLPPPAAVDEVSLNHLRPAALETTEVTVVLASRHPARSSTVLGAAVQRLAEADPTPRTLSWGPHEPVGQRWDRDELTQTVLSGLPDERAAFVAAEGVSAVVAAHRTAQGLEELTHVHLDVGQKDLEEVSEDQERITWAFEELCATGMPLVGLVWARPALLGLRVAPFLSPPAVPLALLIGAPAVRSFGIDVEEMRRRYTAQVVGRPRLPALVFDLATSPERAWTLLDEILGTLDPDRLAEALGLVARPLADARPRTAGGVDAQP